MSLDEEKIRYTSINKNIAPTLPSFPNSLGIRGNKITSQTAFSEVCIPTGDIQNKYILIPKIKPGC